MLFDGLAGDEQRLGDLRVGHSLRRQRSDPAFGGRQRVGAGHRPPPSGLFGWINDPRLWSAELPSANGMGTARALAPHVCRLPR